MHPKTRISISDGDQRNDSDVVIINSEEVKDMVKDETKREVKGQLDPNFLNKLKAVQEN